MKRSWEIVSVAILISIFFFLSFASAQRESLTFDEIVNIEEGTANLTKRTFLVEPYNPPLIRELAAIPIVLGFSDNYLPSRIIIILCGCFLLLAVYLVTRPWFSVQQRLLALLLVVFDPTLLAHSHYITPDVGLTLFIFIAFFAFVYSYGNPSWQKFLITGVFFGLAAASKIPAIIFLGGSIVMICLLQRKRFSIVGYGASLLIALLVIWGTYWFQLKPILVQHDNPNRVSNQIIRFADQHDMSVVSSIVKSMFNAPVPLGDYLGILKNNVLRTKTRNDGWYLLPLMSFLKTPLPFLLVVLIGLREIIKMKKNLEQKVYILVPAVVIIIGSVFLGVSPLIRYLLPLLPFAALIASASWHFFSQKRKLLLVLLLFWYIGGTLLSFPHFISYSNEFGSHQKYLRFNDSNIDWGQGLSSLATYVKLKKPQQIQFSYFGRDDASNYGFLSDIPWGSYKNDEICAFHPITYPNYSGDAFVVISISNWHNCGYEKMPEYHYQKMKDVVAESLLIF